MDVFPSDAEIRAPLLAFLQGVLGPCRYAAPPTPMTPGNDTQVHALRIEGIDEPLVLRVFPRGSDERRPVFEATLQNALAEQGLRPALAWLRERRHEQGSAAYRM